MYLGTAPLACGPTLMAICLTSYDIVSCASGRSEVVEYQEPPWRRHEIFIFTVTFVLVR